MIYFNGHLPVFTHAVDDLASFRMLTSQLCANCSATQPQIAPAFGLPLNRPNRSNENQTQSHDSNNN